MIAVHAAFAAALALALSPGAASAEPPANDSPSAAQVVPALPAIIAGSTADATMDLDEPPPLITTDQYNGRGLDRSVWFTYTPERPRSVLADTCDANFDNHLDVYTGVPGALTPIATTSNSYQNCPGERRTFALAAGVPAYIRVSAERVNSRVPDGGAFHLSLGAQEPPGNDAFTRAATLPGAGAFTASLAFSTIEFGEPSGGDDTGSVWYRLLAPRSEPYTVQLADNPFGASARVFQAGGVTINALRPVAGGFGTRSVSFNALAGHRYYVRVATNVAVAGDVRMDVTTNTARGIGLVVTPARNTLGSVRRNGFRAVLSCARTCALRVDLQVSAREARRLKLVTKEDKQRGPLRIGHVGGALQSGRASTVSVPIQSREVRSRLAHARSARVTLKVSVRGATRAQAIHRTVTLRR
jgi:hypothetical protein